MSESLVKVENVSKKFCRSLKRSLWYGILDLGNEVTGRNNTDRKGCLRTDEFWAVQDVNFEVKRGECLGLIGRNGAGKTTLLRMLNGLIKPDKGRIEMRGRVGGLIALGAGFSPLLTGRENIYVNASVLGLSKRETDKKVDEIIDFAEISDFIDSPVQNYSSGMQVRLGFAVATALEPDILLLDEVLAVGDAAFRYKCFRRINETIKNAAVIFVSHDMPSVARICEKTVVLAHGEVSFFGETGRGVEVYGNTNEDLAAPETGFQKIYPPVLDFSIASLPPVLETGATLQIPMRLVSSAYIGRVQLRVNIYTLSGSFAADCVVDSGNYHVALEQGENSWAVTIATLPLKSGRYKISVSVTDHKGEFLALSFKCHDLVIIGGHPGSVADCQLPVQSWTTMGDM